MPNEAAKKAALQMLDAWYNANKTRQGRIVATTNLISGAVADGRVTMYSPLASSGWDDIESKLPHRLGTSQPSMMDLFQLHNATDQEIKLDPAKYVGGAFLHAMQLDICPYHVMIIEGRNRGWIQEIFFVYTNVDLGTRQISSYVPIVKFNYDWPKRRFVMQRIDSTADVDHHLQYHP
jgi:hypothetical protein